MYVLHFLAEKKEQGEWFPMQRWVRRGEYISPARVLYPYYPSRPQLLLTGVLSGGALGVLPPERESLNAEDGLPKDVSDTIRSYVERFSTASSIRHISVKRLLAYPWRKKLTREHRLTPEAAKHYEITGIIPAWSKEVSTDIRVFTEELSPVDLWGDEWARITLSWVSAHRYEPVRFIYFYTEEPKEGDLA